MEKANYIPKHQSTNKKRRRFRKILMLMRISMLSLSFIAILLASFSIYQYGSIEDLQTEKQNLLTEIQSLENKLTDTEKTLTSESSQNQNLQAKVSTLEDKLNKEFDDWFAIAKNFYIPFKVTYYCPCEICSEGYGHKTASQKTAVSGHTVAMDPNIPFGTTLLINGEEYTNEDVGGGVRGNHIDIFVDTHQETIENGVDTVYVKLLSLPDTITLEEKNNLYEFLISTYS